MVPSRRTDRDEIIEVEEFEDDDAGVGTSQMLEEEESLDSDGIEVLDDASYASEFPRSQRRIR